MANILITGSAGFIGSNLIRYLLFVDKDVKAIGIDKIKNYADFHNIYYNKSVEFFLANICDIDILKRICTLSNPIYIIHLAAIDSPETNQMVDNNIKGLCNVIDVCKEFNCKLIYVSSSDVYDGSVDKKTENTPVSFKNINAAYNVFCENLINLSGIKYNILRAPEIFGSRSTNGVITNMFLDVKGNEKICLPNKGSIINDLLHVEDLSSGILTLMQNWSENQIYNISVNNDYSQMEIAVMVIETLKEGKIEFVSDEIIARPVNLDCSKIKDLKWKPIKKFKIRVQETIYWFNNNKWFFK